MQIFKISLARDKCRLHLNDLRHCYCFFFILLLVDSAAQGMSCDRTNVRLAISFPLFKNTFYFPIISGIQYYIRFRCTT